MNRKYALVTIKAVYVIELEELNIPEIIDEHTGLGAAKVQSVEIAEFDDSEYNKVLDQLLKE